MLTAEIEWGFDWAKMTDEQRVVFLDNWNFARKYWNADKPDELHHYNIGNSYLDYAQAYALQKAGIKGIKINGVDGTMLTKMQDRGGITGIESVDLREGNMVQITLPDMGLLLVNEVDWMEDACTEELQRKLDEGWRILAVCPPNAQRRPDYILGRTKAKEK